MKGAGPKFRHPSGFEGPGVFTPRINIRRLSFKRIKDPVPANKNLGKVPGNEIMFPASGLKEVVLPTTLKEDFTAENEVFVNTINPGLAVSRKMGSIMLKNGFLVLCTVLNVATGISTAADANDGVDVRTTGYMMIDGGYISETEDIRLKKWYNEPFGGIVGGLRLAVRPSEKFGFVINPELRSHNIFPISPAITLGQATQRTRYETYMEEAKGMWTFGDLENPRARLEAGYFIYEDNPDGKVLGNYLFRSMIYPSILFTKMNNPGAYLLGLHVNANFLQGSFRNDVFLLSEIQNYPFFDVSMAYTGTYSFRNVFEIGVGVNARSLVPLRASRTTPKGGEGLGLQDNTYKFVPFQDSTVIKNAQGQVIRTIWVSPINADSALVRVRDSAGNEEPIYVERRGNGIAGLSTGPLGNKAMTSLTPTNGVGDLYPELHGTNTYYSFAGTLVGGRIAVNPMNFIGTENPLGRDAFKLYAEVAVLGWKNYVGYYENRNERMPIMFGVNLPTFNQLDFLSLEVERFTSKNLPNYEKRSYWNIPQPDTHKGEIETLWDDDRRTKDDIKWVLSARRTFRGWGLATQIGTDHLKLMDDSETEVFDVLSRPSQWYAQVRFIAGIY